MKQDALADLELEVRALLQLRYEVNAKGFATPTEMLQGEQQLVHLAKLVKFKPKK
jgi:hypothetical protein